MGCTTSIPPEHAPNVVLKNTDTFPNTPSTESTTSITSHQSTDFFDTAPKKDDQSILSSAGRLEIPPSHKQWFPSNHAHINCHHLFKYHKEIANGTTSSIHHIEYKSNTCALKQIPKDHEYSRMIFETEAQILSMLNHKGIIHLIDMFTDENHYYLLLQKADFDLNYVLKKKKYLSENKTRYIIYALLKTIQYLHRKNIVHRDIKPENIAFLTKNVNNPLLIDFGDAEMVKKDETYVELVGTPPYMSPERLGEHSGWQLMKSDIWAIGAIAYEMHCGQRCFVGSTQRQVFSRIISGDWHWINTRIANDDFKDFVEKCLQIDAKDRLSATEALKHRWFAGIEE